MVGGNLRYLRIAGCAVPDGLTLCSWSDGFVQRSRTDASKEILLKYYKYPKDPKYFEDLKMFWEFQGRNDYFISVADDSNNVAKRTKDPFIIDLL